MVILATIGNIFHTKSYIVSYAEGYNRMIQSHVPNIVIDVFQVPLGVNTSIDSI